MRISGHLSGVGGALIFGCFGLPGKLFLWVRIKCGADRCQVSGFITKSKWSVFKALHNSTICCVIHYIENYKVDAENRDFVIEMPMSLFCFSHTSIAIYMICWETGQREGNLCTEEITFTWPCKTEMNVLTFKALQIWGKMRGWFRWLRCLCRWGVYHLHPGALKKLGSVLQAVQW